MISGLRQYFNSNDLYFKKFSIYVVVNFLSQVIFLSFFFGIVMYANEVVAKEKEKLPEIKN